MQLIYVLEVSLVQQTHACKVRRYKQHCQKYNIKIYSKNIMEELKSFRERKVCSMLLHLEHAVGSLACYSTHCRDIRLAM